MDDQQPTGALNFLKVPALWVGGVVGAIMVVATIILIAWDLFVSPVWNLPAMTLSEAIGASLLVGLYMGIAYALKEDE